MRFLVDAQLPKRFTAWLSEAGHDARHTLDLPLGNRTPDEEIIAFATLQARIVVSKDDDFVQSFLVSGKPARLLLISTGNITNTALEKLIRNNLSAIENAFLKANFVELTHTALVIHE
jgi:predicted nuclease of predicted toxin-antitoxin system